MLSIVTLWDFRKIIRGFLCKNEGGTDEINEPDESFRRVHHPYGIIDLLRVWVAWVGNVSGEETLQ